MSFDAWIYAQQSVLGSVLIDDRCAPLVMRETSERDFQGTQRTVYRVLRQLFLNGSRIDPVVVVNALGNDYRSFIQELMEVTPTAANAESYCKVCRDEARAYQLRELGSQMQTAESLDDLSKLMETASALMTDRPTRRIVTMQEAMKSFMERHSAAKPDYLHWPIHEMDKYIYAEPGDFIIIGAEPSVGKTAFALQCAYHFAKSQKVGFFSLETTDEKLFDRKMAGVMEIDMGNLKQNKLCHDDWERICGRSAQVIQRDLELIPASGWTAADIRATTVIQGYKIIFVDYVQLVQGPGENRPAVVAGVSMALHTLAQSLGVTVIALSQLTVDSFKKENPSIDSLRESRQLGQDADVVIMLTIAERTDDDKQKNQHPRKLTIQKNKEGRLGSTKLYFDGARQTFSKKPIKDTEPIAETAPVSGQMEMLPDDYKVPF